nr:uncharacterized protein LOC127334896 [Lolium perenne]
MLISGLAWPRLPLPARVPFSMEKLSPPTNGRHHAPRRLRPARLRVYERTLLLSPACSLLTGRSFASTSLSSLSTRLVSPARGCAARRLQAVRPRSWKNCCG